jgi:hypothetical protein
MSSSTLRRRGGVAILGIAAALVACAAPGIFQPRPRRSAELLREFREGRVRLECGGCRFDARNAEWLLREGRSDELVVAILRSGDGSGRSWYLLGRAAEQAGAPEAALRYYRESLATSRSPIVALLPLYEDVNYRVRSLLAAPARPVAATEAATPGRPVEYVTQDSAVVRSRPGQIGAFLASLHRGDKVEVLDRSADWEQVRLPDGRVGWVYGRYTASPPPSPPPGPTAKGTAAAATPAPRKPAVAKRALGARPVAEAKPSAKPAEKPSAAAAKPLKPAKATATAATPVATQAPTTPPAGPSPRRIPLTPAGSLGILGCPLPAGASLARQSHGAAGHGDHPTQTYEIPAVASDIAGFYEGEMERAGWRKSFVSSEYLLYFVKEDRTLGILIEREGGTFTLMGS